MAASVHRHRSFEKADEEANKRAYRSRVIEAVNAEIAWLKEDGAEPTWPQLPPWHSHVRPTLRISGSSVVVDDEDDAAEEAETAEYVDEHALGAMVGHLVRLTVGELPAWVEPLTETLLAWTGEAYGPHG